MDCKNSRVNKLINLKTLSIISVAVICVLLLRHPVSVSAASNNNDCTLDGKQLIFERDYGDAFRFNAQSDSVIDSQWYSSAAGHGVAADVSQNKLFVQSGNDILVKNLVTGADITTITTGLSLGFSGITGAYNGFVYVSAFNAIAKIDTSTNAIDSAFITGTGAASMGLTIGPDNMLYAVDNSVNPANINKYDPVSGSLTGIFIDGSTIPSAGVIGLEGISFGPDNNLYLANSGTEVYRFNGTSGAFIDTFFTNSGGLTWSIAFSPNSGDMYVVSIIGGDNIVKVTQSGVATVITGTPGAKSVHILPTAPCSYSLGNRVWIDYTLPGAPTNNDGVMNSTEQPRQSVSVTLLDGSGIPVDNPNIIGTQDYVLSTDSQGYYRFDGLDTGTYKVRINSSNFGASASLEGYLSSSGASATFLTDDNATDHGIDTYTPEIDGVVSNSVTLTSSNTLSDKDVGAVGAGDNATLGDVTDNLTVDFGFIPASRLGDYFWIDANKNGLQDSGELPVQNVAVTLLDSFGVAVSGYSQQNTDALGAYHFLVYPGTYKIRFTNLPNSYVLTTQNSSSSETNTSKADSDGVTIGVSVSLGDSYLNLDGGIVLGDTTVVSTPNPTVLQSTGENVLLQFMVGLGIITSVIASNVNIQSKKLIEN